ncbi:MAG TPA: DinB family protein [Gemmatimonadales bacterium]
MAARSYLAETLDNWRDVRRGLIEEIEGIRATSFDFRPTPEVRSVRELIQHILESAYMATGELSRPDTNFRRAPHGELLAMYGGHVADAQTKRDLLDLLHAQLAEAEKKFRAAGDLAMGQWIKNFDGSRWTKMQWLHHAIAHEMYHRGQVTVYERLMGLEPALTKRIKGE